MAPGNQPSLPLDNSAAPTAASPQTNPTPTNSAPTRPETLPEKYWNAKEGKADDKAYRQDYDALTAFKATEDSRKLTLPKAGDFKLELPKEFKPPEGIEAPKFLPDDPLVAQYRSLAEKRGFDQETFTEGLGMIAALRTGEEASFKTAYNAEVAKLGATGPQRIDAVITWMNGIAGDDAAALANSLKLAPVAGTIVAFEKLMAAFRTQGAGSFSQQHRDGEASKVDDAAWAKMSTSEKQAYARAHNQSAFTNGHANGR